MTSSSPNPRVAQIRQQVRDSYDALNQLVAGPLSALDPTRLYQVPEAGEWTIMENLAHIVEFMPYWADEVAQLVATPGQNFGRTMQHEGRLSAIREHGADNLAQVQAALPGSYAHLDQVLASLNDRDLELTGQHSRYGERTLAWFIQDFITDHLANHVTQIKSALQAVEEA